MPYCPTCHTEREGQFCAHCGTELLPSPPSEPLVKETRGDTGLDRSVRQTVVVTPTGTPGQEAEPSGYCPIDGLYVRRDQTFRCRHCGREHLCREHLDAELRVCEECAAQIRKTAQQELEARLVPLWAEAEEQLQQGNLAEALLACGQALALASDDAKTTRLVEASRAALRDLAAEVQRWQQAAEEAKARVVRLQADLQRAQADRDTAHAEQKQLAEQLAQAQADLSRWKQAAEQAQARLSEIEERERAAEEARRRAEQEAKKAPIWQQIGIEMVTIPAGEFLYGEGKRPLQLPEYQIAKTPVTNAQYKAFVDATGHRAPDHWKNGQIPQGEENHPVVYVSWKDAQAFCDWAGCRLPTEREWEKAARGTDGREYPWGDEWEAGHCNTEEAGIGGTTPVGWYPEGASPYGLLDMAGNVWEWCGDWYDDDRNTKVLRGGSWYNTRIRARCAYRNWIIPDDRNINIGFRCCAVATSSL